MRNMFCVLGMLVVLTGIGGCEELDGSFNHYFGAIQPDGTVAPQREGGCHTLGGGGQTDVYNTFEAGVDGPDLAVKIEYRRRSVKIAVLLRGKTQTKKTYNESFLTSHKTDTISLPTSDGTVYRFMFWGSENCEDEEYPDASVLEVDAGTSL